ncbi:type I 3-dehydroquinate dehydratase [Ramlibacter tataouinensis]|uniref:type I 3-dehydroquinate dehydratase n=1 Tax=Ramlibacter tataouinensis TaxID=94132 RepID=UPI0022F3F656|nr:type I 3-dehydroquinate dehydratase [Ramlibacter tataouinensis]WBY03300.1 type I 3-dehydroquinate dehydratase [Ramlibacter tataouinensis]
MKPITLRGKPLAGGALPAVCVPLVGRDAEALLAEVAAVAAEPPDLLEWRVDFFAALGDIAHVVDTAVRIRQAAGVPLLFTRRSQREGGQPIALNEPQVLELYRAVCMQGAADIVDVEMAADPDHIAAVREAARANGIALLLSFHDFDRTPPVAELLQRFRQAGQLGADIAKLAVMPRRRSDVLALLQATLQASEELPIPVAGMAMGALGAVSRLCGGEFGSALTFAVGRQASAPGQLPLADLRRGLSVLRGSRSGS